ncbi:MAG: type II secretion system protein GspN [Deltaproteobacteria bacterium]|jgi:type II secretion system protein N
MPRYKTRLGYVLFATVVCILFLYVCFPSGAVRDYLEGSAGKFNPPLALTLHNVRPAFPFGLKLEDAALGLKERPGILLFKADSFVLMPSMRILNLRGPAFRFACAAYGGKVEGAIAFKTFSFQGPFQSDVEMTDVRLGHYPYLTDWLKRELTGTMSGSVTYDGSPGGFPQGSGQGDFSILNGSVRFAQPFLGVESVSFRRIDARMVLEKQDLSLARFDFEGKELEGEASGTVHLNPHFSRSTLDLRVALKASSAFLSGEGGLFGTGTFLGKRLQQGDFKIHIRGTVAQPRIDFI